MFIVYALRCCYAGRPPSCRAAAAYIISFEAAHAAIATYVLYYYAIDITVTPATRPLPPYADIRRHDMYYATPSLFYAGAAIYAVIQTFCHAAIIHYAEQMSIY